MKRGEAVWYELWGYTLVWRPGFVWPKVPDFDEIQKLFVEGVIVNVEGGLS